jgi:membrane-associated protease RseP (regulator of RpoE activity)
MGSSLPENPVVPEPGPLDSARGGHESPFLEPGYVPPVPVSAPRREPLLRYVILFLLTLVTTTFFTGQGFWYSLPVLAILSAHEFGHYFACRYYGVAASLPYFLPLPIGPFGTLGAVIRIRQPIPGKRALFDIGIAGPIAGFLVAIPFLLAGVYLSTLERFPAGFPGAEFGEPILFRAIAFAVFGPIPDDAVILAHPMAMAAWFGLLATALNLFPIGQLDGGHISYAVLGRHSTIVTILTVLGLIGLTAYSFSWILWTVLTIAMLVAFGPRHPRTHDEEVPLDGARLWLALFAVVMFVLCFTPTPIDLGELVQ